MDLKFHDTPVGMYLDIGNGIGVHSSAIGISVGITLALVHFTVKAIIAAWSRKKAAKRARAVSLWKRATGDCKAHAFGGTTVCIDCGQVWDTNEDDPPPCKL